MLMIQQKMMMRPSMKVRGLPRTNEAFASGEGENSLSTNHPTLLFFFKKSLCVKDRHGMGNNYYVLLLQLLKCEKLSRVPNCSFLRCLDGSRGFRLAAAEVQVQLGMARVEIHASCS